MADHNYSWTEFLAMDEPTLAGLVDQGTSVPFVQQSMARRALTEVRRRAWAELQQQRGLLEQQALITEDAVQAGDAAEPAETVPQDPPPVPPVVPADDSFLKAMALSEEALATARDANGNALTLSALAERLNQRIRWANMIAVFAAVVALIGMWRS